MIVQPFFVKGIAHSSYLLGGSKTCAVVDPQRDVQVYLDAAQFLGLQITHVLETHLHADFISGHLDLARATGAKIYAPAAAGCAFDHVALSEGDNFEIEDMAARVLETPGHTPEHISYVVSDTARGDDPAAVFCGDTLFVGDVGRPDLFPGRAWELASSLFDSLHTKLLRLPDFCEVYPAHGAGSLCGRAMAAKRASTIGYERRYNPALQIADREVFIRSLTTDMPPAPDHFSRCSAINGQGPALVRDLPPLQPLDPPAFYDRSQRDGTVVLDVRNYAAFGAHHVPGAYSGDLAGNFATFAGWIVPPAETLLVTDGAAQAHEATVRLRRVGLDQLTGYLEGGLDAWAAAGLPTDHVPQLSALELHRMVTAGEDIVVVDVRSPSEYATFHIDGALNIPVPDLRTRHVELDQAAPTVVICGGGRRSTIAASLLQQRGFQKVYNAGGGMTGYAAAGLGPECPFCFTPHAPRFLGRKVDLEAVRLDG
jgi:glyoxylase-like metal-dependent hydrolase (beta-lactamase superfamily II)/rhodanese-related sulfurtransferase